MNMDYGILSQTLTDLGYADKPALFKAVVELAHTLDAQSLAEDEKVAVAELFGNVVKNYSESSSTKNAKPAVWSDFILGQHQPGITVRVRRDAYEAAGAKHNGLVGTVTAIRGGRVLVQYTGRSDGIGHAHHPSLLEVLEK